MHSRIWVELQDFAAPLTVLSAVASTEPSETVLEVALGTGV